MFELAKSTGFSYIQAPQDSYLEVLHNVLPDPTAETSRSGFVSTDRKDAKIKELLKKSTSAYLVDAMVRQAVDKYSEMFKSFDFEGGEAQVKYLRERFTQMTLQTGEHWETLITRIIHEYFKTGNAFIIKRRGNNATPGKRALYKNKPYTISGLSLISPERLEIKRNNDGEFVGWELQSLGKEKIRLVLPGAYKHRSESTLINVSKMSTEDGVLTPGVDLVHVAYKRGADSHYGFGLTFPALEDISLTRTIEQITAIMLKKFSNPIIHHKITKPSSPLEGMNQEISRAYQLYRTKPLDGVLITGGNAEIKAIGSESQALRVESYLKYFLNRALAGLGVSPFILGLEGGGQGTLEACVELMMMKVRFCQAEIARELEMFLINELLWEGGYDPYTNPDDIVKLVFEDIDEDRTIKLQTHSADMFQKNMWGLSESRKKGRTKEPLDENDLYLNRIDIPKTKAEAEAKGSAQKDAGVAIAKAKPKPVAKKKSKEVLEDIKYIIPQDESQLTMFMQLMEKQYSYDASTLVELYDPIKKLLGDPEAIKILLIERLTDGT